MSEQKESHGQIEFSIIKVEGKPATVLVEKISSAISGSVRPWQIRRIADAEAYATRAAAQAEADAERIRIVGRIETDELQRRAMFRFVMEESNQQRNMESITAKAIPLLNDSADPERVENDWIVNFFDKSRLISDDEMQLLWARVLAGEANSPGKFSKRTINALSSLDARDAAKFSKFCATCWEFESGERFPVITFVGSPTYRDNGIPDDLIVHLNQIGLITYFGRLEHYSTRELPRRLSVKYFDETFTLELSPSKPTELPVGQVIFTSIGKELGSLCDLENGVSDFRNVAVTYWRQNGITILPVSDPDSPAPIQ